MRIGEVANHAAVNVQTLRYYERRGLIPRPARSASGYRTYAPTTVDRVRFVKRAQSLGFTLQEIAALLALRVDNQSSCARVEKQAKAVVARIEEQVGQLRTIRRVLGRRVGACERQDLMGDCPILQALEEHGT